MKKTFIALAAITAVIAALTVTSGCKTATTVTNGVTNTVTFIDPVKLQQASDAIQPAAASVLRRAILKSPDHAAEIGNYARAVGGVFCQMKANNNFTPQYLIDAANAATAKLQATAPPEVIDAKNAAIALYKIFLSDQTMVNIPNNGWASAVCGLFCDAIDQALKDAGQVGVK